MVVDLCIMPHELCKSWKKKTQNNKNVIFVGFDGLFPVRLPKKAKPSENQKKTFNTFRIRKYECTECKFWDVVPVTFTPKVKMGSVRLPNFLIVM